MTKRHFEAFARAIKAHVAETTQPYQSTEDNRRTLNEATYAASLIAMVSAEDNPRFDRYRFMKACGLEG